MWALNAWTSTLQSVWCCVTLTTEWWTMRTSTRLCSDKWVMNSGSRYRNCVLCSANKNWTSNNVWTAGSWRKWVQLASIWSQNELLEGLWRRLWDQEAGLISPKGSLGWFAQFRPSILEGFSTSFWNTLDTESASKDEVSFRCNFGIEFWSNIDRFWYKMRTEWRSYFVKSSEMRKVDFWTTVHVFWRFLLISTILGSMEFEAKINFETRLKEIPMWHWFFVDFGVKNH